MPICGVSEPRAEYESRLAERRREAALAPAIDGVLYESRGRQELRNVREPVELVAAVGMGEASSTHLAIDPVCHMAVDPDRAAGRLVYESTTYFFCTLACAGDFAHRPERFT